MFRYVENSLFCDKVKVSRMIQELQDTYGHQATPVYLYSKAAILENFNSYKSVSILGHVCFYSPASIYVFFCIKYNHGSTKKAHIRFNDPRLFNDNKLTYIAMSASMANE